MRLRLPDGRVVDVPDNDHAAQAYYAGEGAVEAGDNQAAPVVGEQGPELRSFPDGVEVAPHGDLSAAQDAGGSGTALELDGE